METKRKQFIKFFLGRVADENNYSLDEFISEMKKENYSITDVINQLGIKRKDIELLSNLYGVSFSSIYNEYKQNSDFTKFIEAVEKIRPYQEKSEKIIFNYYNSFVLNALLHINKYRLNAIEGKDNYIITSTKGKSYTESLTLSESGNFGGLSFTEYTIYNAIQSIIQNTKQTPDNQGFYRISLKEIYQIIYKTRWDKSNFEARKNLFNSIVSLNLKISKIGYVKYYYAAGHDKYNIGNKTPVRGTAFFGSCNYEAKKIDSSEIPEGEKSIANYSAKLEAKENFEKTVFCCSKGILIDLVNNTNRVITIPDSLITAKNIKNNVMTNYYITRSVMIANNKKNKMTPSILFDTLETMLGTVSRPAIKNILDNLVEEGYIQNYSVTAKKIDFSGDKKEITILKDENKEKVKLKKIPQEITDREKRIRAINQFYSNHHVTLNDKTLKTDIRQIFNQSWDKGGRLYNGKDGFQFIRKDQRKNIKIDGDNTVELDFSCYQINILYALKGLQAPADCYSFISNRPLAKMALNIAINAENLNVAEYALLKNWNEANPDKEIDLTQSKQIIDYAIKEHSGINDFICSGIGGKLQKIDSDIALDIITKCRKQGVVALSIHDSFIVAKQNENRLKQIMIDCYKEHSGGFSCPIK